MFSTVRLANNGPAFHGEFMMNLNLRTKGITRTPGLRQQVESCAERVLGRLKRRVSHVFVSSREHERETDCRVHVCTLRLCMPGSRDTLIESLRTEPVALVDGAYRRAKREILRRRREAIWRQQLVPLSC
jgi:hypothetical protein